MTARAPSTSGTESQQKEEGGEPTKGQRAMTLLLRGYKCVASLARLQPVRGRRTRVKHVTGLTGLDEAFHHRWYQRKAVVMADRRDWGGGGDDPEESTQRMIERIWESLTDIRMRMDQQAPVQPLIGGAVPVAPVPPQPGVEVPFVAPVPPSPPMISAEVPVVQVERFLRLQPPTYIGGPNPDTAEHWIHEIKRVFMTMRCPVADRVLLATYQLRGFSQEWWRLKMQTTFAVQQAKMDQFRTLQQGETSVLEYQMRFMALSRESGRSRGNAGRSLHNAFFVKVVDAYRGYLSSWVPQVLLTSEAHPYSPQARARRRFLYRRPVRSYDVAVLAQRL
ncbi:hypothetical protein Taro_046069 [Colocasia esculenta]|uniref:Gag protein n=1 Tax=Colocasia esculenta TaxID=4460 RepID=A0A843WNT3_COLES|nr:hypothetical protein [Colocasia esculenta]